VASLLPPNRDWLSLRRHEFRFDPENVGCHAFNVLDHDSVNGPAMVNKIRDIVADVGIPDAEKRKPNLSAKIADLPGALHQAKLNPPITLGHGVEFLSV